MRMSLDALLIGLAFALGACLARSSLCVVAAMQELVEERRATGVLTQALALTAAGAALAGLATVPGHAVLFPADAAVSSSVVIGAVILAAGALVNGGCYLGSILYLGRGRSEFLFTLVGMAASSRLVPSSAWRMMRGDSLRGLADGAPQVACALFLAVALVLVLAAVRNAQRRDEARSLLVRRLATPAVAGALAALLYARHPYFSYGSVLDALAHADAMPVDWVANAAAVALFAGAVASSWLAGTWNPRRPSVGGALRRLAGGALMGAGAALIPGGNDLLVLWAVPGLTAYGAVAYATLLAVVALAFVARRAATRAPR